MEILNEEKQKKIIAFLGKDEKWHFINEDTRDIDFINENIISIDNKDILVDEETQAKVIEIISNQE